MDQIISYAITILSLVGAILAWVAKLRWSKEYATAKDETIKAREAQIAVLEAQIKVLQDFTPMKIQEYFVAVKKQLEDYNDLLQNKLKQAEETIKQVKDELEKKLEDLKIAKKEKEQLRSELITVNDMYASVKETLVVGTIRQRDYPFKDIIDNSIAAYSEGVVLPDYIIKNQEAISQIIEGNKKLSEKFKIIDVKLQSWNNNSEFNVSIPG